MYFKRLEIFGFKSFADKTVLHFGPGITAIIGPNGCGKSNIFDAIRWVLGEQSVKELRGSSMEDIIFNGTDKKPGLGFSEVSLTFSNESKTLPVDYDEVTVTRRLFRSGESEYLLNKTSVRLKDITELFMGTGIGAEAYSLVQQGKVDLVVSARPEDRRIILDEASGITKYKSKRKEALSKLKDTENNLLRINDIVVEVKRQISSLERQASKAHRYKGEFEKLKDCEVQSANYELDIIGKDRQENQARLEGFREQEAQLSGELGDLSELIANENNLLEELEEKISEVNAEYIKMDGQVDINEKQIGFNEERLENVALNKKRILESKTQLIERCRVQQEKITETQRILSSLDELLQNNSHLLQEKKDSLHLISTALKEAKDIIREEEESILDVTSKQVHVKNRLTEIMKEIQGGLARKRRLEIENTKVSHEKEEVDFKLSDTCKKIETSSSTVDRLRGELSAQNNLLNGLTGQLASLDKTIDELEKKKLFFKSQKEFIEKLSVQYKDIPDPIIEGRLITDTMPQAHHTGIIGKVKEVLPVGMGKHENFKNNFSSKTETLYEIICETKFIELDPQQISTKIEELSRDIEAMQAQKENVVARVEEQQVNTAQVEYAIQEEEKTLSVYAAQKKDICGESDKIIEELELVKMELEDVSISLGSLKKTEDELSLQLDTLNQALSASQIKIKDKQDMIAAKAQDREDTTVAIAQLETEVASVRDKKVSNADNLQMFSEEMDNNLEEIKRIENEYSELEERKLKFADDIEACQNKIVQIDEQKQSLSSVLAEHAKQKDELVQKINSLRANVSGYTGELEEVKNAAHTQQMREQEIIFKEREIKDRLFQTYRIDLDELNQEVKTQEATAVSGDGQEQKSESETNAEEKQFDPVEMKAIIERLKKRCESFGSVNLVAIEEFEELRERFEFLTKQQSDLISSKESLHKTIGKINRQTRQMFMDTFTKVSEEFRIYYRMLFGGGDAQLVLLDPDNVLESGIEIIARPPGKKLQNISLLSGGEKTLTAIALIFGVFKVKPSPFCVLDEIDAALDESNVGRFSYLLKDFAKIAQFIVITHNKKTIASANVMYGITMQETGVSRIVSVKFSDKEKERQEEKISEEAVTVTA